MEQINFSDRYLNFSTEELLEVIDNAQDYKPTAVETAKKELQKRGLSASELDTAKENIEQQKAVEAAKKAKQQANIDGTKERLRKLNPIKGSPLLVNNQIKIIGGVCLALALLNLLTTINMYKSYPYGIDSSMLLIGFSLLLELAIPLLFFFKKTFGWILLTMGIVGKFIAFIVGNIFYYIFPNWQDPLFFFKEPPLWSAIFISLYGIFLFALTRKLMRQTFKIKNWVYILTITLTSCLVLFGNINGYFQYKNWQKKHQDPMEITIPEIQEVKPTTLPN